MRLAFPENQSSQRRSTQRQDAMVRTTAAVVATSVDDERSERGREHRDGRPENDAVEEGKGGHHRADDARADGSSRRLRRTR